MIVVLVLLGPDMGAYRAPRICVRKLSATGTGEYRDMLVAGCRIGLILASDHNI